VNSDASTRIYGGYAYVVSIDPGEVESEKEVESLAKVPTLVSSSLFGRRDNYKYARIKCRRRFRDVHDDIDHFGRDVKKTGPN